MNLQTTWIQYGADDQFSGYLAKPEGDFGSLPAVIVLQEIWGVDAHIRSVTERFAAAGYVAFAPDLYSINGKHPEPLSPESITRFKLFRDSLPPEVWMNEEARAQALAELQEEERNGLMDTQKLMFQRDMKGYLQKITEAATFLREQEPTSRGRRVASVGFCLGGGLSAQLACHDPELAGAVIFYGSAPGAEQLQTIACPIIGFYGGKDARITDAVPAFSEAMSAAGKSFVPHVYPEAPHAFFNDTRASYRVDAARDAFARTLAFLNEQLA
ncbi:dienelactone hydrolase family protein [Paenibacillus cremeus]|uniref:Dienelactone hydrolase family protein n=1 Tax=Paenibacillus cremeus TaxID=2163881 RepID=A0A559K6X9_9BACL|nr:dienelactone hydrolase family protein [Paenibacillus cremeus]TVY07895.1 dienelactone hydrolase family protein [Paenibacillus cremeus]